MWSRMSFSFLGSGWWKEVWEIREKCAWEVLDGSAPCLVSLTLHFLRATLCKRVNTQRLTTSWAISENVDQKYPIGEHVHADLLGHKRGCILPSRFPTWENLLVVIFALTVWLYWILWLKQRDSNTLCLTWKRPAERKMVPNTWAVSVSVLDRQAVRNRSKLQLRALSLAGCVRVPQGVGACAPWGRGETSNSRFKQGNRDSANYKV